MNSQVAAKPIRMSINTLKKVIVIRKNGAVAQWQSEQTIAQSFWKLLRDTMWIFCPSRLYENSKSRID